MGAVDFLEKPFDNAKLLERVRRTLDDVTPPTDTVTLEEYRVRVSSLTPGEQEVMKHMVLGKAGKRIAHDLGISYKTLEKHRRRVLQKMQVGSVALLIRLVMQFQQVQSARQAPGARTQSLRG